MNNKKLQKLQPAISKLIGKHNTPLELENTAIKLMNHGIIEYIGYPKPVWRLCVNANILLAGALGLLNISNHTPYED